VVIVIIHCTSPKKKKGGKKFVHKKRCQKTCCIATPNDYENINLLKQTTASNVGLVGVLMMPNQAKEAKALNNK
jgi:hypothetical protein